VNPSIIYGPFAPNFRVPKPDFGGLSSNLYIYHILTKNGRAFPTYPGYADVRDVARIHVEALTAAPESSVGRKRLPIASHYGTDYKQAVQFVADAHPELRDRLVDANTAPKFPVDRIPVDFKRVEEVTGVKVTSYHTWKESILDTIDSLLALERNWISQDYNVEIPALEEYGFDM
jgi:nucleoside-diphosphate-sugar epimerase